MQQGGGALKENLNGCAKQRHLVEVQPKTAAGEAKTVMQNKGKAPNSTEEDEAEEGVIDEIAIHDAAPEKVPICKQEQSVRGGVAGARWQGEGN